MTLDAKARERLADVRELEPTTNGELAERWAMDGGSDVARYLRRELGDHLYRGDDHRIRVRDGVGPEPGQADADAMGGRGQPGRPTTLDGGRSPSGRLA